MLLLTTGGILLVLAGAGCSPSSGPLTDDSAGTGDNEQATNPPGDNSNSTSQESTNQQTEFTVQAESTAVGVLKISWTAPSPAEGSIYKILYGTREHPDYGRDFWYERSNPALRNAVLTGLKPTTYYVRICEFKNNMCVNYSNEVQVEVKE